MTETLYREFKIDSHNVIGLTNVLRIFWTSAVMPFVASGKRVVMIVTSLEAKRNNEQNRRYFGYILKTVEAQAWVAGQQFDKAVWHEHVARMFGVMEEMILPDGEIIQRRKSTAEMSVGEFAKYMTEVEHYASTELGCQFEA
jgi:hypothetical protein